MSKVFRTEELKEYRDVFISTLIGVVFEANSLPTLKDVKYLLHECISFHQEAASEGDEDISTPMEDAEEVMLHWDYPNR